MLSERLSVSDHPGASRHPSCTRRGAPRAKTIRLVDALWTVLPLNGEVGNAEVLTLRAGYRPVGGKRLRTIRQCRIVGFDQGRFRRSSRPDDGNPAEREHRYLGYDHDRFLR